MTNPPKLFEACDVGSGLVIRFVDQVLLDWWTLDELGRQLLSAVEQYRGTQVTLDFDAVDYISTPGLTLLLQLRRRLLARGGRLVLRHPGEHLRHVLSVTRLELIFQIDEQPALLAVN